MQRTAFSRGLLTALISAAALATLSASPAQATLLTGQTVTAKAHAVLQGGGVSDGTPVSVVAPGATDIPDAFLNAVYADSTITLANIKPNSSVSFFTNAFPSGVPFTFNGVQFTTAAATPAITAVAIDAGLTNLTGFTYSFDANNLFVDLKGVTFNTGDRIAFNLNGFSPNLPEPATWAMMVVGVGLVGGAVRRRPRVAVRFA